MKIFMFLIFFLLLGGFFIIAENNIQLNDSEGFGDFVGLYGEWIDGLVDNGGVVSGYVVKMGWLPGSEGDEQKGLLSGGEGN